jgi:hypothetical protein
MLLFPAPDDLDLSQPAEPFPTKDLALRTEFLFSRQRRYRQSWVKSVVLTVVRPLPIYPGERTSPDRTGMSQKCQHATSNVQVAQKKKPPAGGSQF